MSLSIDHIDALDALDAAYQLICEFGITIDQSLEGDHPMAEAVDRWLTWYEKAESRDIQGHPV